MSTATQATNAQQPEAARGLCRGRVAAAARGAEIRKLVLQHVYRFGCITPKIAAQLCCVARQTVCSGLQKQGLLAAHDLRVYGLGRVFTLTKAGLAWVESFCAATCVYEIHEKVKADSLRHDFVVQRLILEYAKKSAVLLQTEREYAANISAADQRREKVPDAVLLMPGGARLAIEVEISPKRGRKFSAFILQSLTALNANKYDAVLVACPELGNLERFKAALAAGSVVQKYALFGNKFEVSRTYTITSADASKFKFKHLVDVC